MMYYHFNDFCPFGFFGSVFGPALWIIFVLVAVLIIKRLSGKDHYIRSLDILKERYAKGEINKEQFESMKKDLM